MNRLIGRFGYAYGVAVLLSIVSPHALAGTRSQPVSVTASTSYDPSSHMHVYAYSVSNPTTNTAPLDTLVLKLQPGVDLVTGFTAPPGWRSFYSAEKGTVMWAAVGYLDAEAADPSGNIPPSDYAVAPGGTLTGFSIRSFSPPGAGTAITQTYAPLPAPTTPEELEAVENDRNLSTLPEDNGYSLTTTVPIPDVDWLGNRRPAVDGFLVFANLVDKSSFSGSSLVVFRLGSAGETVDKATLRVSLNSVDVTSLFVFDSEYNGYVALFDPGTSPIKSGTNVLRTSVDGIVPGTGDRVATDTDRVTFNFTP